MARLILDDYRSGFEKGPWWHRLFNGYSVTTWMVVLNLGSTGLLVSWLMKYADNIVKVSISFIYILPESGYRSWQSDIIYLPIFLTDLLTAIFLFFIYFKVYSTSMAMLLTMVLSVFLFNFKPTLQVGFQAYEVWLFCHLLRLLYFTVI